MLQASSSMSIDMPLQSYGSLLNPATSAWPSIATTRFVSMRHQMRSQNSCGATRAIRALHGVYRSRRQPSICSHDYGLGFCLWPNGDPGVLPRCLFVDDADDFTDAIWAAVEAGNSEMLAQIVQHYDLDTMIRAVELASRKGFFDVVSLLLDHSTAHTKPLLYQIVRDPYDNVALACCFSFKRNDSSCRYDMQAYATCVRMAVAAGCLGIATLLVTQDQGDLPNILTPFSMAPHWLSQVQRRLNDVGDVTIGDMACVVHVKTMRLLLDVVMPSIHDIENAFVQVGGYNDAMKGLLEAYIAARAIGGFRSSNPD
ncbi:Aste57867_12317 [Aphanomyces stellatus]|uniref:Aste57867_12317 protein n=1 Tax=Aphanomyces stellatus TaxID=120398 RepID=A0A485KV82_9STRA|nr:hypothetical protein As57867_012271 [Aphanomyces stellatus]VFT89169.1 Aste57867_12317 [Aphanomyces stellatus]